MLLADMGWNDRLEAAFQPYRELQPARVCRADRTQLILMLPEGTRRATIAGRLRHESPDRAALPVVGDWVAAEFPQGDGDAVVHAVLPRVGVFSRSVADDVTEQQIVATNIDTVFLVNGLDGDFNPRRIERYLAAMWETGAVPVIVLNKADACAEVEERIAEVEAMAPGVAVHAVSATEGRGLEELEGHLTPGATIALLGSSGVGKSTLVNALLGEDRQVTGAVREHDQRGRHTTTHRELVPLPNGAWLLDTPGMRALKLWNEEDTATDVFGEIAALAARCKFRDCRHESEPGCAVQAGLASGELDASRYTSWRKLEREQRAFAARHDIKARLEQKARWKRIHVANRKRPKKGRS